MSDHHTAALDGLRAVAFLLMYLFHSGSSVLKGGIGVDIFIVLRGFLATRQRVTVPMPLSEFY